MVTYQDRPLSRLSDATTACAVQGSANYNAVPSIEGAACAPYYPMHNLGGDGRESIAIAYNAHLVRIFLAYGSRVLADERAFRVEYEREWLVFLLRLPAQGRQVRSEMHTIGCPRARKEYEVEELHALQTVRFLGVEYVG